MTGALRALGCAALVVGLMPCCSLLIDHDIERVRCSESGRIGPPACDVGEICAADRCQACLRREICGDDLDNDCNERVDDACGSDAGTDVGAPAFEAPAPKGTFENRAR